MLLGDIQKHAALAAADHDAYVEYLVQLSEQESNGERISQQKEAWKNYGNMLQPIHSRRLWIII